VPVLREAALPLVAYRLPWDHRVALGNFRSTDAEYNSAIPGRDQNLVFPVFPFLVLHYSPPMLFNSYGFIFAFLPVALLGFFALGRYASPRVALGWMALSSLFFYGYWKPIYLLLLLFSIGFNFTAGLCASGRLTPSPQARRVALFLGVLVNLGLLGYFKYANFFVDQANSLFATPFHLDAIFLPLAISFFTFQQIAYLVDAYRGYAQEHHFIDYCLFVTFFPQLIAGPIVHHRDMMPQFAASSCRFDSDSFARGLSYFVLGLFKKVVIADSLARFGSPVFDSVAGGGAPTLFEAWSGVLAYTGQIYFDFSGYSDMAIGLGLLIGIHIPVNFNSPYKATGIADFWRRWHITLSQFLRDYLYIPLGGNRKGPSRRYVNLMLTMLLGGLWHGAGWTFVVWGGLHGLYLVINHGWGHLRPRLFANAPRCPERFLGRTFTLLAVILGWVYFRANSAHSAHRMIAGMLGANGISVSDNLRPLLGFLERFGVAFTGTGSFDSDGLAWVVAAFVIALVVPNTQQYLSRKGYESPSWLAWKPNAAHALFLAVLALCALVRLKEVREFLYFQF